MNTANYLKTVFVLQRFIIEIKRAKSQNSRAIQWVVAIDLRLHVVP